MIGGHPIAGAPIAGSGQTIVIYAPVSRIMAGGWSNSRPPAVAVLGVDLLWDDEQEMIWDDEQNIGWEA